MQLAAPLQVTGEIEGTRVLLGTWNLSSSCRQVVPSLLLLICMRGFDVHKGRHLPGAGASMQGLPST